MNNTILNLVLTVLNFTLQFRLSKLMQAFHTQVKPIPPAMDLPPLKNEDNSSTLDQRALIIYQAVVDEFRATTRASNGIFAVLFSTMLTMLPLVKTGVTASPTSRRRPGPIMIQL